MDWINLIYSEKSCHGVSKPEKPMKGLSFHTACTVLPDAPKVI